MKRLMILLCLLAIPAASALASDANDRYLALVHAAKSGHTPVDWQALRLAYAESDAFDPDDLGTATARHGMFEALQDENDATALSYARKIIDKNYVDIDAHRVAALAYKALDDGDSAAAEQDIAAGLVKSVMTGDGQAAKTAFTVITVHEEYAVIHALGRDVTRQALINEGGHSYDLLETVDATGGARSYYFLVDRVLAAEATLLKTSP
jgi:uncharacterized protein DUF4919